MYGLPSTITIYIEELKEGQETFDYIIDILNKRVSNRELRSPDGVGRYNGFYMNDTETYHTFNWGLVVNESSYLFIDEFVDKIII